MQKRISILTSAVLFFAGSTPLFPCIVGGFFFVLLCSTQFFVCQTFRSYIWATFLHVVMYVRELKRKTTQNIAVQIVESYRNHNG